MLRTIPVDSYSKADNVLIYAGISSYVGGQRGLQNVGGGVLVHIKDLTRTAQAGSIGSPAYTSVPQVFHTDIGDIVSLMALDVAAEGGTSRISSSWRVYNELAETRPDLIKTLTDPWPFEAYALFFSFQVSSHSSLNKIQGSTLPHLLRCALYCITWISNSSFSMHEGILPVTCISHVRRTFHPLPKHKQKH